MGVARTSFIQQLTGCFVPDTVLLAETGGMGPPRPRSWTRKLSVFLGDPSGSPSLTFRGSLGLHLGSFSHPTSPLTAMVPEPASQAQILPEFWLRVWH